MDQLAEYTRTIGDMLNRLKHTANKNPLKEWVDKMTELLPKSSLEWSVERATAIQDICTSIENYGNETGEFAEKLRYAAEDIAEILNSPICR